MPIPAPLVAVLDNEALQALGDRSHPKHRRMLAVVDAVASRSRRRPDQGEVMAPTAVRVEALVDRRHPASARLNAFRVRDVALDPPRADRAASLRRQGCGSAVDATVAEVAVDAASRGARVTVYTADPADLTALAAASDQPVHVVRV